MQCRDCGVEISMQRNGKSKRAGLCPACGRKRRLTVYFRQYYLGNRQKILSKNRRWAEENRERVAELRRLRAASRPKREPEPTYCIDCGTQVVRATRCRKCYVRHKYASDPDYRARRLETTRRWANRRRAALARSREAPSAAGLAAS